MTFVVDTLQCKSERLFAHVGEKVLKAITPSIAYGDASATMVFETLIFRIVAPCFHVRPSTKCGAPSPDCMAVSDTLLTSGFLFEASARLRIAASQIASAGASFSAAIATAFPMNNNYAAGTSISVRNTKDGQATVLMACDIIEFGHRSAPTVRGSSGGQTLQGLVAAITVT